MKRIDVAITTDGGVVGQASSWEVSTIAALQIGDLTEGDYHPVISCDPTQIAELDPESCESVLTNIT